MNKKELIEIIDGRIDKFKKERNKLFYHDDYERVNGKILELRYIKRIIINDL